MAEEAIVLMRELAHMPLAVDDLNLVRYCLFCQAYETYDVDTETCGELVHQRQCAVQRAMDWLEDNGAE
jgi:hypothetical protein